MMLIAVLCCSSNTFKNGLTSMNKESEKWNCEQAKLVDGEGQRDEEVGEGGGRKTAHTK